jgi:CTP synthase
MTELRRILLCRTDRMLPRDIKSKIALFCNVSEREVITALDVKNIYEVPMVLHSEALDTAIMQHLQLPGREANLDRWERLMDFERTAIDAVSIGIVGKYVVGTCAWELSHAFWNPIHSPTGPMG